MILQLAVCSCSGDVEPLAHHLRTLGPALSLELDSAAPAGAELQVYVGKPWRGSDGLVSLVPGVPPLRMVDGQLLLRANAKEIRRGVPLKPGLFAELPRPCVIQALLRLPDGSSKLGRAFVIRLKDGALSSESFGSFVARRDGPALVWALGAPLLVALGLALLSYPRWLSRRGNVVLVVFCLAGLVALRIGQDVQRLPVERGLAEPPLLWPSAWDLDDDVFERTLGPGFRTLVDHARQAQLGGLPLTVWSGPKGKDIARAVLLAQELDGEARFFAAGVPLSGLSLFVGVPSQGDVLMDTDAGVLCRHGDSR